MNYEIFTIIGLKVTPRFLGGGFGSASLAGRWFAQIWASHKAKRSVVSPLLVSELLGEPGFSPLCLLRAQRPVGFDANRFALTISCYNLWLNVRSKGSA